MIEPIIIYTDGACRGNPGPGGWGVLLQSNGKEKELCGGELQTTNNRMEIMAAIVGLEALKKASDVHLYTDSQYLIKGITEWMVNWKKKGWKTASGKPVKNEDLWSRLDANISQHQVKWFWVKGHSGDKNNDRADRLANLGLEQTLG